MRNARVVEATRDRRVAGEFDGTVNFSSAVPTGVAHVWLALAIQSSRRRAERGDLLEGEARHPLRALGARGSVISEV